MSEFRHLQRCPWFNSPKLVNTRAQGWPQLGWSLEIFYNSKKPTETCAVPPVKMLHQCCIILPQMLTARSSGKKKKNYWNDSGRQDMLSAENAMNLSSSEGLRRVRSQSQKHTGTRASFSFNSKRSRRLLSTFQACFSSVVKDCAISEWPCRYKIKIKKQNSWIHNRWFPFSAALFTVQFSRKSNLFLLILRGAVVHEAENLKYYVIEIKTIWNPMLKIQANLQNGCQHRCH